MNRELEKDLERLNKKEEALLKKGKIKIDIKSIIYKKAPKERSRTLETSFEKTFFTVFVTGTKLVEKTFAKEDICLEYEAVNYSIDQNASKKNIKRLDHASKHSNFRNQTTAAVSGAGLGLIGFGLPDIPFFVSTILRGIYETALSYGFTYDSPEEKMYILRLIETALTDGEEKVENNKRLDGMQYDADSFDAELTKTAKLLSDFLLVERYVQGIPVVGMIGGSANLSVYKKIAAISRVKYKKRYLKQK